MGDLLEVDIRALAAGTVTEEVRARAVRLLAFDGPSERVNGWDVQRVP